MEFYTEFRTRGADFGSGFTNGMTMTGSGSVSECCRVFEDEDKTIFTCLDSRDKMKLVLKDLNLPFYDPFTIIEKTEGRMAEDDFWIRIER